VERRKAAQEFGPQGLVVFVAEEIRTGTNGDPRAVAKFIFQLTGGPSGITDERPNERTGFRGVLDGVLGGQSRGPAQAFFPPPKGGKRELFAGDRSALMNRYFPQTGEILAFEKIPDDMTGWLIQNQTERAIVVRMFGQQDDRPVESPITQRRIRQKQLAFEMDRRVGRGRDVGHGGKLIRSSESGNFFRRNGETGLA